uniref:Ycf36 n=1 Tax=Bornetia secundiflora TaxID=2575637 RepID=A0A4D6WTB8_9FLOR|nr:hypothetical protein [Bornetia secundiflora]
MAISKSDCPVPFDQQPLNEYLALKKSWLFYWSTYRIDKYIVRILILSIIFFLLSWCLSTSLYPHYDNVWEIVFLGIVVIDLIFLLILVRLYLGWSYIIKRLLSATIFYEESGWYDGQVWIKKSDTLIQDRLVAFYQILPIINRIKNSLIMISIHFVFNLVLYSCI